MINLLVISKLKCEDIGGIEDSEETDIDWWGPRPKGKHRVDTEWKE